ncbi:cytochrome P450 [Pholiota conissans]|uniref:Cytochrome P450 n=1 Tax=Pholiota conissans TaxID=109636 RepID=A0A9P5Z4I4_9AGAR|nr:cytochrome P450 [Pholiota conissans]
MSSHLFPSAVHTMMIPLTALNWTHLYAIGAIVFLFFWTAQRPARRKLPYPPGPPAKDWISGNARELLADKLHFTFINWGKIYGPIFHLKSFNTHILVINSFEDAVEIMEKRSNNYSDRPYIPMIDLVGWTFNSAFKPYGPTWQAHRRALHQTFNQKASVKYRPLQIDKMNDMLHGFLETPEDFMAHIKTVASAVIMSAMYGYDVSPKDDYFTNLAEEGMSAMSRSYNPGASIVNVLPILRHLPTWFPGAEFHRVAKVALATVTQMQEIPYKFVRDSMAAGTASPSFVADNIEGCKTEADHKLLKEVAATGYGAPNPKTAASITTFIYAMALRPDVQKRAQEEIDRVIGQDRLANFDDEASLPYIRAICQEVLRWRPVLPLCVFHASVAEDVYKGYYIPKGIVHTDLRAQAMTRDPDRYDNPEDFNPDRYMTADKLSKDDITYTFGFGRRICPGMHLASASLWLAVVTTLSAFDIRPPKDAGASGNEIPLEDIEYTGGLLSHASPFKCSITPRSDRTRELILDLKN